MASASLSVQILVLLAAYLIGSVSFGVVVSKLMGLADPHTYGSGNPGATNVLRTGNKKAALFTLLGDVGKGVLAVLLGIVFEQQNIAFLVSLAFAIAASANFPVLLLSVLWKGCTTRGAVIGGFLGLASSVILTVISPSVWEATLGNPRGSALFPYTSPALFSMTIGFIGVWLFSLLDGSPGAEQEKAAFAAQQVRSETGLGAARASSH